MLHTKRNFVRVAAGSLAAVLALVSALVFLPRAFAEQDYFTAEGDAIVENAVDRTVTVEVKAAQAVTVTGIQGNFSTGIEDAITLTDLAPSEKFTAIKPVTEGSGYNEEGKFQWTNAAQGAEFASGETIWTATYTVEDGVTSANYGAPVTLAMYSFGPSAIFEDEETLPAAIVVTGLPSQELSFAEDEVEISYGEAVPANELTVTTENAGTVTYVSSNDEVATVNENTGVVTVVKPGEVTITATAAATNDYAETSTSYALKINKASVSITSVGVADKIYNGTTNADVSSVVLSVDNLDYDADAEFENANVGNAKTVTVTVTLTDQSADLYELTSDTAQTTATISPFGLDENNVSLSPESFTYSGAANEPAVTVTANLGGNGDVTLTKDTDYTVTYEDDTTSAGTKTVTIDAIGNFTDGGLIEIDYEVEQYELTAANIGLEYDTIRYDGSEKKPDVTVKIGDFVVENEYTVEYSNNTDPTNAATVIVTAKDNMNIKGSASVTFEIVEKDVLTISGVSSQEVTYTGSPVVLVGTLAVSNNTDNITVADLTTKWYESDGVTETSQPSTVGSYVVKYSYDGTNYAGLLVVPFEITKAISPEPAEMMANFRVKVGTTLAEIEGTRTTGFAWANGANTVSAGAHNYAATYVYNNDADNYTTLNLNVPVYGLTEITIDASVDGDGGTVAAPAKALEGDKVTITFTPEDGYEINKVTANTFNITSSLVDNKYTFTAGTSDVDIVATFRKVYQVVEGDGVTYTLGASSSIAFKFDANFSLFENGGKVYFDGMLLTEGEHYTATSGSTVIAFTQGMIDTIAAGEHTVMVLFNDGGVARAGFVMASADSPAAVPDTGFFTGTYGGVRAAGLAATVAMLTGIAIFVKKKFAHKKVSFDKK